ncbi:MAG: UDP-N-acetylmuramate:L-alanyl-gamma-D-glutamyl-meso-diaminopimelate ligase [Gammaproteobacteria bacterium]|nr:UDP-N-acetylmuramate:L-alanyl-gamma-D-glutamyl-meso-diaminopimelate ligase [Gammaproteobacteria bacterium]
MKIHILGICGTFMGGIAQIAQQLGHEVRGCDAKVYPPMSTQLEQAGIKLIEGYDVAQLDYQPDMLIMGNAMTRGNPLVEYALDQRLPYTSGPQWLSEQILQHKWVLAVSGTHGKTTTSSMLTWILEHAGLKPSYLIGGVPENFGISADLQDSDYFVIEADEYDTAFFDKRSKFVHYHPKTLIINNIEYDHADIFEDLAAIQKQFHHLVRIVPETGLIVAPSNDDNVQAVLAKGSWTPIAGINKDWQATTLAADGSQFDILHHGKKVATVQWPIFGAHNVQNALAAIAAAHHVGITPAQASEALSQFKMVKRRMEVRGVVNDITVYDDFAHHPTAIKTTTAGLRARIGNKAKIIAVIELGSNTMRGDTHKDTLIAAASDADQVIFYLPEDAHVELKSSKQNVTILRDIASIIQSVVESAQAGDHVLIMSNRGFGGIHQKLLDQLAAE